MNSTSIHRAAATTLFSSILVIDASNIAAAGAEGNLVANPGFEVGGYDCGMSCSPNCNVTGWAVSRAEYLRSGGGNVLSHSGTWALDLNMCSTGWAYQDVACQIGQTYQLSFALGASWPGTNTWCTNSPAEKRIRLSIGAASEEIAITAQGSPPPGSSVQYFTIERQFVATESVVRLRFDSLIPGCSGAFLDDVEVTPGEFNPTCRNADLLADRSIDGIDLGILLGQWGPSNQYTISDINHDGVVDGIDLGLLLSFWGPCPY